MPIHQNLENQRVITDFLPAVLKQNKSGWLIKYYAKNPHTSTLYRKQIKLGRLVTRYATKREAKAHIGKIIVNLNAKLTVGWSPFYEGVEDTRLYDKLSDVARLFIEQKTKELRENTLRSYKSFITIFLQWTDKNFPNIACS
jgi:hypothetical protein